MRHPSSNLTQWQWQQQQQPQAPTPARHTASIQAHRQPFRKYNHSIKINSKRVCEEQTDSASWQWWQEEEDGRGGRREERGVRSRESVERRTHGNRCEEERPPQRFALPAPLRNLLSPLHTQRHTNTHRNVTHLLNIRESARVSCPLLAPRYISNINNTGLPNCGPEKSACK